MDLRKDYLLERWVIVSRGRSARPHEFKADPSAASSQVCYFCPGNEKTTPKEIGRMGTKQDWDMRWFQNKFPAVDTSVDPKVSTRSIFLTQGGAYGQHEVIVETPLHTVQLYDTDQKRIQQLLGVYANRTFWMHKDSKIKYVHVFKNHGKNAGTSLMHSHSQIISLSCIPPAVQEEVDAAHKADGCPYCKILDSERVSERKCFENDSFVAFAPFASRFNYEIWLFPKKHVRTLMDLSDDELADMAAILLQVLRKLKELGADFNYFIHYAPEGSNLHLHMEVTPRLALWAGFELCGGVIINSISPEEAALFYRS